MLNCFSVVLILYLILPIYSYSKTVRTIVKGYRWLIRWQQSGSIAGASIGVCLIGVWVVYYTSSRLPNRRRLASAVDTSATTAGQEANSSFAMIAQTARLVYLKGVKRKVVQTLRVGAGGSWRIYNERFDPNVVKQQSKNSCGPACGEMLFRVRGIEITQEIIEQICHAPVSADFLARTLNRLDPSYTKRWAGGMIAVSGANDEDLVRELNKSGSWAAMMWERGASISHLVVIDGLDDSGRLKVRDPWEGTSYTMEMKDFLEVWSGVAVGRLR